MIILTSNGISSPKIKDCFSTLYKNGLRKVAVIVTADPHYREQNYNAVKIKEIFLEMNFQVCFFDIEFKNPEELLDEDLLYFIGGNPFYLLNQIRKTQTDQILRRFLSLGKVISGASAGSVVLGQSIALIEEFNPEMNIGITDFKGLHLTNVNLCPHYTRYKERYQNFEERIKKVEQTYHLTISRIDDGEAIVDTYGTIKRI